MNPGESFASIQNNKITYIMGKYGYNHGDFGWNELAVTDTKQALDFYTNIFGWTIEEMEMPGGKYYILINGEEKIGGITQKPAEQSSAPTAWLPYLTVENVDEAVEKAISLGGKVILPPCDIPVENGPRLAVVQDPFASPFGIITYPDAAN